MRPLLMLVRGFGLFALVVGFLVPLSVSAQGDATPAPGGTESFGFPITAYLCDTDPGGWSPYSGREIGGGCEPAAGLRFDVTAEVEPSFSASCTTDNEGTCYIAGAPYCTDEDLGTLTVAEDVSTLPAGYAPRENPVTDGNCTEFRGTIFINILRSNDSPTEGPAATQPLTTETDGSTVAIYAGDCDTDFSDKPVATLTNVRAPAGETQGPDGASAVETSFTTLDLPLNDILADDHVLVVFDEDDDTVALACGAIGGIVTEDGTLVLGLSAIDDSRYSGVAYLSEDGDQTDATIFLAEDLSADATPTA